MQNDNHSTIYTQHTTTNMQHCNYLTKQYSLLTARPQSSN